MIVLVFLATELGNNLFGPNVVFSNILNNLSNLSLHENIKFVVIFNESYKGFEFEKKIGSFIDFVYLKFRGYWDLFFELLKLRNSIVKKYGNVEFKFFYPKPMFMPFLGDQFAFLYDLPYEKLYLGKSLEQLRKEFFFKKLIWKNLKKIFTISRSSFEDIKNLLGLDNLDWIYLGVDRKIFHPISKNENNIFLDSFFRSKGLKSFDSYYFCPAGKIWYRKNILNLVKAFDRFIQQINQKPFLIITANNLDSKDSYVRKVIANSSKYVIFLDKISIEELVHLYNGAEAVILPSFYEGFGLPVLEALACNKIILFSNIKVFNEIYSNNHFVFNPNDVEDICKCMLKFYYEKDKLNKNRILQEDILEKFKWEKSVQSLIQKLIN